MPYPAPGPVKPPMEQKKAPGTSLFSRLLVPTIPSANKPPQKLRFALQLAFLLLIALIGLQFHNFVSAILEGTALPRRPPGVEGFLPISALMSLKLFLSTGEIHWAHPAALFILLAIIAMSFAVGKSFCGWLCPFGFLSELLHKARKHRAPAAKPPADWLDYSLGAVKYIILAFFAFVIFISMNADKVRAFLGDDYNKIADIKMYFFFAHISFFAAMVITALFVLSYYLPYFWCRYLCPYGALLGLVSLASPSRIRRYDPPCISCGKCAAVCPQRIAVDRKTAVYSDECTSCGLCLDVCPAPGSLELRIWKTKLRIKTILLPLIVTAIFCLVTGWAMLAGHWKSGVTEDDYRKLGVFYDSLEHP